jgi:uncharacterized membrane protein
MLSVAHLTTPEDAALARISHALSGMSTMYSRVKIAGHPVHPMLIAFPVTFYTTTLIAFAAYALTDNVTWWQLALRANVAGVITAAIAAVPGLIDWITGVPPNTPAKTTGRNHMLLNLASSALFVINLVVHRNEWTAMSDGSGTPFAPEPGVAIVLSILGVACMLAAGFLGWKLVQTHHVGIDLSEEQQRLDSRTGVTGR